MGLSLHCHSIELNFKETERTVIEREELSA